MNKKQTKPTNPTFRKFLPINPLVSSNDIMGWSYNDKGKMVPMALWQITAQIGRGCRAKFNKDLYGFTLYAWQIETLLQLQLLIEQREAQLLHILSRVEGTSPPSFDSPITQNQLPPIVID